MAKETKREEHKEEMHKKGKEHHESMGAKKKMHHEKKEGHHKGMAKK